MEPIKTERDIPVSVELGEIKHIALHLEQEIIAFQAHGIPYEKKIPQAAILQILNILKPYMSAAELAIKKVTLPTVQAIE